MNKLWLDWETLYSDQYTLKKMTPVEYVLHPMFESLGCAFCTETTDPVWVNGPDLPEYFKTIDWPGTHAISHNALFDMLILQLRYGIVPGMYGCTMKMASNWVRHATNRVSLNEVSKYYGLPPKLGTLQLMKGVNYYALRQNPQLYRDFVAYGCDDVSKCRTIFRKMMDEGFPERELEVIDMVIRMATQPRFEADPMVLADHLTEVLSKKQALLDAVQMDSRDNLLRDAAFALMLNNEGVQAPMKVSKTTGKEIFAFAKTDKEFQALLDHDNPNVQALVAARLGHKSTLEETRTTRFLTLAQTTPKMAIPLNYSGAHTHRFSGAWGINMQNLPRGGKLRKALRAPTGYKVVSVDASQIEARINAVLSSQWDLVDDFEKGVDVYAKFAAEDIYKYEVTKARNPKERFVGKTGILSLGYGSSPPVFQSMCRNQGGVILTDYESVIIVAAYRRRFPMIVNNWRYASIDVMGALTGRLSPIWWGPVWVSQFKIKLPNGNFLYYDDLRNDGAEWTFRRGPTTIKEDRASELRVRIYGAKIVENVVQALAFVHIMEVALRVKHMTRGLLLPAHQVHDELIYIVREHLAEQVARLVVQEMSRRPEWMPHAPLAAEAGIGPSYGETK